MRTVSMRHVPEAMAIPLAARFKMLAHLSQASAPELAEQHGAPERVVRILAKSVGATMTTDPTGDAMTDIMVAFGLWSDSLRTRSAFFALLPDMAQAPFLKHIGINAAGATAWMKGEGAPIPVSRVDLTGGRQLQPLTAATIMVATEETIRDASTASLALLDRELRGAVADVVDDEFFGRITTTSTPQLLAFGDAAHAHEDILRLLNAVNSLGSPRLHFVTSPDVAKGAAALYDATSGRIFPAMTPMGGEIVGVPVTVSSVLPAGTVYLIDAAGIVGNRGTMDIDTSRQASLQLTATPTTNAATPTETTQVSLWQTHSVGLKAQVVFGAHPLRDGHVAMMSGIGWSDTGSPA